MKLLLQQLLWLAPFSCFLTGYLLMAFLFKPVEFKTPSLVGKSIQEAIKITNKHDLHIKIVAETDDPDLPDGTIISQTPTADTLIKARQSVYMVISQQPALLTTPSFLNKPHQEITSYAENKGITLKTYLLASNSTAADHCIAQYPAPANPLVTKSIITYICSDVLKPVIMPNFKGKSFEEVQEFLQLHNIASSVTHIFPQEEHHTCQNCTIYDQRPLAGSIITLRKDKPLHVQLQLK